MALRARKVSGVFEKRAHGLCKATKTSSRVAVVGKCQLAVSLWHGQDTHIGENEVQCMSLAKVYQIIYMKRCKARCIMQQSILQVILKGQCHEDFAILSQFWAKIITLRLYS